MRKDRGGQERRRTILRLAVLLPALVLLTSCSQVPQIRDERQPYLLYRGDPTRMTLLWQFPDTAESTIEWGLAAGDYSLGGRPVLPDPDTRLYSHTLTGLSAGTRYHYRVSSGAVAYSGTFHAAPANADTPVRLVAYGDSRSQPEVHDQVAAAILSGLAAMESADDRPSLVLHAGDLVSDGDRLEDWSRELFDPAMTSVRALMASRPYQVARGNHEESGELLGAYFPYQGAGAHHYSFDSGPCTWR